MVEGVEVQAGRAVVQQVLAQLGDHIHAEGADRGLVVAQFGQAQADPARHFGAAHFREAQQLGVVGDGHDARHDRHPHTLGLGPVDEVEVGVGVEEVLGDGGIGARLDLGHEVIQIRRRIGGLRVHFGIGRHFDVEPIARFLADERHQFVGVAQFAGVAAHARGQVAAQGDHAPHAFVLVGLQDVPQVLARGADARQVRRRIAAQVTQRAHRVGRAGAGGAAGAERHADVLGLDRQHLLGRADQPLLASQVARRKEFQAESRRSRVGHIGSVIHSAMRIA